MKVISVNFDRRDDSCHHGVNHYRSGEAMHLRGPYEIQKSDMRFLVSRTEGYRQVEKMIGLVLLMNSNLGSPLRTETGVLSLDLDS